MRKELIISTIPQETRVALVEDDELVEFLIERHRAQAIVGNIYKGRVTKVLPGMQSAFVDIGLERDAFLYVSDFVEDGDEYERIVSSAEDKALEEPAPATGAGRTRSRTRSRSEKRTELEPQEKSGRESKQADGPGRPPTEPARAPAEPTPAVSGDTNGQVPKEGAAKDTGPRKDAGAGLEETNAPQRPTVPRRTERRERRPRVPSFEPRAEQAPGGFQVLPGETLAKYKKGTGASSEDTPPATQDATPEDDADHAVDFPGEPRATDLATDTEHAEPAADPETGGVREPVEAVTEVGSQRVRGADEPANAPDESDKPVEAGQDESGEGRSSARITDPPSSARFSRPPVRRSRRRQPAKSEGRSAQSSEEPKISDLLRAGQEILVQVSKEPLGKKGARITSHIALPGRYLVYMPTVDHVGVSRKISTDDERGRLRQIINDNRGGLPGGFIVRTAAEGRSENEFVQDLRFLGDLWKEIREKSEKTSAPAVIHSDLNLIEKFLRDQLTEEFLAIRLDSEVEYARVLEFVSRFQPSLVNRVRLHLKETPILEEYGLQQEIDKAMKPKVWLKSGGYIVVNQTEALVAIDVNTGKFVGKSNRLEDTIVRTNIDAVHEIVRQIRLRNLGGIIVVDFIDMEERKNRQRVMQALEEELRKDKSPSKSLQFNDFGLVAITRKRTQASLERVLGRPCPRCSGAGFVKALETVCYEIQHEVRKMLSQTEGRELTVRVNPEIAKAIKGGEFVDFTELEEEARIDIRIKGDPALDAERFDIF